MEDRINKGETVMPQPDIIKLDIPASHKYLNVLRACIGEMLLRIEPLSDPDITIYNIQLAVHETCANIVDHAYAGRTGERIAITLTTNERRVTVELRDTGAAFNMTAAPEPDLDQAQVHGYGLFLIRNLMDEVVYEPGPQGNYWRLSKQLA